MKSKYALVLAIGLGLAGAMLNYSYLVKKSHRIETVDFVGIASEVEPGELLTRDDLVLVPIPKDQVGNLGKFAVQYQGWGGLEGVLNQPAPRLLEPGTLLLEHDLATPPAQLELAENERAWPIPIDTRVLIPSLIEPGDQVWFLGTATPVMVPTTAEDESMFEAGAGGAGAAGLPSTLRPSAPSRIIGPFTVLALGNRLGSVDLMRKEQVRQVQENVMLVRVTVNPDGSLRSPAGELLRLLEETNSRPLGYLWRPRDAGRE